MTVKIIKPQNNKRLFAVACAVVCNIILYILCVPRHIDKIIFSNWASILHKYADWIIKKKGLFKSLSPIHVESNVIYLFIYFAGGLYLLFRMTWKLNLNERKLYTYLWFQNTVRDVLIRLMLTVSYVIITYQLQIASLVLVGWVA